MSSKTQFAAQYGKVNELDLSFEDNSIAKIILKAQKPNPNN